MARLYSYYKETVVGNQRYKDAITALGGTP